MITTELVLSHYTIRRASFRDRVRTAAENGFAGIGLDLREYESLRAAGHSDAKLRGVLDEYGQRVAEHEVVKGWSSSGAAYEQYRHQLDVVARMADAFGPPHHVQVVGPYEGDFDAATAAFAALCDRLGVRGIAAALEYLPEMSNIPDAAAGLRLVEAAGRDNGGLCVDSWHHFRSGEGYAALAAVPGARVIGVQFDDGPAAQIDPDYKTDCMTHRRIPGEGDFDLVGFVRTLDGMGVDAAYSIEVVSVELDALPVDQVVRSVADATRDVLARARATAA